MPPPVRSVFLDNTIRAAATPARRPHLHAIDLVRVVAIAGVIGVHTITLADPTTSVLAGAALSVLHVSRELFFALTALVLAYQYRDGVTTSGRRLAGLLRFWRHRYLLVLVPYVVWSGIYFVADGVGYHSLSVALRAFALDLLTGAARYHLYFLLVTMQLYLVFPLLMAVVRWSRGHHRLVFLAALAAQLAFVTAHHQGIDADGLLGFWIANPDALLPSYVAFWVTGALLGDNLDRVQRWVRRRWALALVLGFAGTLLAVGVYEYQVRALGELPTLAAEVFQPAVTIESLTALLALLAVGAGWAALLRPRWLVALIRDGADSSFGVYLAHPLFLQALIVGMTSLGLLQRLVTVRESVAVGIALLVLAPITLAASWLFVLALRQGPLSLALTGRARRPPRPAAPARSQLRGRARASAAPRSEPARSGAGSLTVVAATILVAVVVLTQAAVDQPAERALASSGVPLPTRTAPPRATPSAVAERPGIRSQMVTIESEGLQRRYDVLSPIVPTSTSLPVIVFLQGLDSTLSIEEGRDGLQPYVTAGEAILVYPVAENEEWDTGEDTASAGVDDIGFLRTVLRRAAQLPGANPQRVYLAGFSRGGRMAWELACQAPDTFAALVIIAAVPLSACPGAPAKPLLQLAGTDDTSVPYATVTAEVAAWAAKDGCTGTPTTDDGSPTLTTYSGCRTGEKVVLATYQGEGHVWPGGDGAALPGPLIWSFLSSR